MPASRTAPFTAGQAVQVHAPDFTVPGFPTVWHAAIVTDVQIREDGKFDVQVQGDNGKWYPQIVGNRGGNRRMRAC